MSLFGSLFGSGRKTDWSQMIPNPPHLSLAPGSQSGYQGGIQNLLDTFGRRSRGEDQFDYLRFLFEPQQNYLNQQYGINTNPGDVYSSRTGALPQTLASLNQRGLLDSGTSGVIEAQLRSDQANKLAELFGQSKQLQRQDIDTSLDALNQLYPTMFDVQNIQPNLDYQNQMADYQALLSRNQATVGGQQARDQQKSSLFGNVLGLAAAPFTGGGSLFGNALGGIRNLFGGGGGQSQAPASPYQSSGYQSANNPYRLNSRRSIPGLGNAFQPVNMFGGGY